MFAKISLRLGWEFNEVRNHKGREFIVGTSCFTDDKFQFLGTSALTEVAIPTKIYPREARTTD